MNLASSSLRKPKLPLFSAIAAFGTLLLFGAAPSGPGNGNGNGAHGWQPFTIFTSNDFRTIEKIGLISCVIIALAGLVYAFRLMKVIYAADQGTSAMQAVAKAVRQGADAYLYRQFKVVMILLVVLTGLIVASKWPWYMSQTTDTHAERVAVTIGRGIAFLMGSLFSASVGFIGMRLATAGNLRVAAASKVGFGEAMRMAYRTGTVTGMFTCGLGLLGGSLILIVFGELAYETLLGFGFGGSLLALFMRVGGGIYTKAADVGADLVGKVEANIAEDDPRNAATIADNVGDNVGDCAGMAADVFESYAVTMVAAVILGFASLGHIGMIFPLMVMAIGVIGSMISTALVGKGMTTGNATSAMKSINIGFWRSAIISIIGFMALSTIYLRFDGPYIVGVAIDRGLSHDQSFRSILGLSPLHQLKRTPEGKPDHQHKLQNEPILEKARHEVKTKWNGLTVEERQTICDTKMSENSTLLNMVQQHYSPIRLGYDYSAALCCLIGILLAIMLNRCTEYWTSTDYSPVKEVVKASRTGHATNIISGLALGYESSVWAVLIIAGAILGSVMIYSHTDNLLFIAFGVAMCGIGMLTLTGDTISMDVFGPIADNANGIGEMAFNRDERGRALPEGHADRISEKEYEDRRRVLTDLDAVGNTTKAITKGIAIGSAVIAAVSLFASFIAVLVTGAEEKIGQLTVDDFKRGSANLTVADPYVFIGMLIGGAVPLLFSSMTIRAVGRAAYLIVNECRKQFQDKEIWAGNKSPDYGRVVDICTGTAQKELVGPGLLAICTPVVVGFLLGPFALGGFLAGMILCGQLLAVFMANAGGAWDNAKKMIEDEEKTPTSGKGSEKHKASVTGDTVGDPLKDTAGPAINPLIKVMNMVSLLALPLAMQNNLKDAITLGKPYVIGLTVTLVAGLAIAWAWWQAKRQTSEMQAIEDAMDKK